MKFPLVMYLSRSRVAALPSKKKRRPWFSLDRLKASLDIGLAPKISVSGEWSKNAMGGPQSHGEWPPAEAPNLVTEMESILSANGRIGGAEDLQKGNAFPTYRVSGLLKLLGDWDLNRLLTELGPSFPTQIIAFGTDQRFELFLSSDNLIGVRNLGGSRYFNHSATSLLLRFAAGPGYPITGLFTAEPAPDGSIALRSLYFVSFWEALRPWATDYAPLLEGLDESVRAAYVPSSEQGIDARLPFPENNTPVSNGE